jgi:hypothetical protein
MPGKYDIFNKKIVPPKKAKVLSGNDLIVMASSTFNLDAAIDNRDISEYLVQSFTYQYGMPSTVIRELGSDNQYVVNMPPQGSMSLTKIVGNKPITDLLSTAILDHRYPGGLIIIKPTQEFYDAIIYNEYGEEEEIRIDYNLYFYGVKAEGISGGGDANSPVIQETVSLRFTAMEYVGIAS